MIIIVRNYYVSHDAGREKTEWQATWRITASVLTPDKVKMNDNRYICIFKITELLHTHSLVDGCV